MEKDKVPQDEGITAGISREVQYAVDKDGKYVKVLSKGWEPKNIVNELAWDDIQDNMDEANEKIKDGKASPIMFFMAKNIMDTSLLANYIELPKWKVKKHLKPKGFNKLDKKLLQNYADIFKISVEELINYKPEN